MRIEKAQVVDILRSLGKDSALAERELPDEVDTDEHADLLGKYGISAGDLLDQFGGPDADNRDSRDAGAPYPGAAPRMTEGLPAAAAATRGSGGIGGGTGVGR
jgi:hypothetical protein